MRRDYEREVVWLPELARAVGPVLHDFTFVDCVLTGPALVTPLSNTRVERCVLPPPEWFIELPEDHPLGGCIGIEACRLLACRFDSVALIGSAAVLDHFRVSVMDLPS